MKYEGKSLPLLHFLIVFVSLADASSACPIYKFSWNPKNICISLSISRRTQYLMLGNHLLNNSFGNTLSPVYLFNIT